MRLPFSDDLQVTASYMAVQMLPPKFRENYVRDMSVFYSGDSLTAILQTLSSGFTDVCLGILGNFLYDQAKARLGRKKRSGVKKQLATYESQIDELRTYIESQRRPTKMLLQILQFHEKTLLKIREQDPEIRACVEDALKQLESSGKQKLATKVSSYWKKR